MKTKDRVRKGRQAGNQAGGGAERELKFEVPAERFSGLLEEMNAAGARPVLLHAVYHDTAAVSYTHLTLPTILRV